MKSLFGGPAYKIISDRLAITCWNPIFAKKLDQAINDSRESLLPWMPWAKATPTLVERTNLLRSFRSEFDTDTDYVYGVFDAEENEVIGGSGLHKRVGAHGFEIGYWINIHHQNKGYATETSASLIRAGFELFDIDRIDIRCNEKNLASLRVIEKLGLTFQYTQRRYQINADGEYQNHLFWSMYRSDYELSKVREANVTFYGATGEEIGIG